MKCDLCKQEINGGRMTVAHYACEVQLAQSFQDDIERLTKQRDGLLTALKGVFDQFQSGALVRNTDSDGCSDWALKATAPLLALANAKTAIAEAEGK